MNSYVKIMLPVCAFGSMLSLTATDKVQVQASVSKNIHDMSNQEVVAEMRKDVKELFEAFFDTDSMSRILKSSFEHMPQEVTKNANFDRVVAIVSEEMASPALLDEMLPLFEKYYTHDEMKELLAFQRSPVGKKSKEIMPLLMQSMMPILHQMNQRIMQRVMEEIKPVAPKNEVIFESSIEHVVPKQDAEENEISKKVTVKAPKKSREKKAQSKK